MISTCQAIDEILALFKPLEVELVPLRLAHGRTLAEGVAAQRDQPPFPASAMDGYAVCDSDATAGNTLEVIGESAAGSGFSGKVSAGKTVRIFTGAPVPDGADRVIIQEDVTADGITITLGDKLEAPNYVRAAGSDFKIGDEMEAPRRLSPSDVALLASMNIAKAPLRRQPVVAIVATGDELVMPGENPGPDQIIASNNFGLAALLEEHGAEVRLMPIARDNPEALKTVFGLCDGADLIVTIGGASVGDHDIVHSVASELGLKTSFYKVAMRPGKPLMAGHLDSVPMIGLPGNPVSAMVCGHIFLKPAINAMLGLPAGPLPRERARLSQAIGENGNREHYMRASLYSDRDGQHVTPSDRQDSALLSVLANANALLVRPPHDPAKETGDLVEVIRL